MERAAAKRRWRLWHIIAAAILGVAILAGGIVALAMSLTRPVVTASDTFMTALKDGDFHAAYAMGTPELRRELGSPERLGAMFVQARPATWSWSSRRIRNGAGSVSGSVAYSSGGESDVAIFLVAEGDDWKISGFRMNPR
jgi:hypothetical protein